MCRLVLSYLGELSLILFVLFFLFLSCNVINTLIILCNNRVSFSQCSKNVNEKLTLFITETNEAITEVNITLIFKRG